MGPQTFDPVTASALRAGRGDRAAAAAFVRATQAEVWRFCLHLSDRASADDLTQETYARAFASLHRFSARSSARTWLLSIARRVCADAVRATIRRRTDTTASTRPSTDPADTVTLAALLDSLSPQRREAFILTQLLGLTYAETADVLNCPIGTVRSRVARARTDLLHGLADQDTAAQ